MRRLTFWGLYVHLYLPSQHSKEHNAWYICTHTHTHMYICVYALNKQLNKQLKDRAPILIMFCVVELSLVVVACLPSF